MESVNVADEIEKPYPRLGGSPPKINADRIVAIVRALMLGAPFDAAVKYAGIAQSTAYGWRKLGRERIAEDPDVAGDLVYDGTNPTGEAIGDLYVALARGVERADGSFVISNLAVIEGSARAGDWKAAAWRLERRAWQEFGRRDRHEVNATATVSAPGVEAVLGALAGMTPEQIAALAGDEP